MTTTDETTAETPRQIALRTVDEILRASDLPIETLEGTGTVLPDLSFYDAAGHESKPDEVLAGTGEGWINTRWGDHDIGGVWVDGEELTPYRYGEMTATGSPLMIEDLRKMGLALPDDKDVAEELREIIIERIQRASVREAQAKMRG